MKPVIVVLGLALPLLFVTSTQADGHGPGQGFNPSATKAPSSAEIYVASSESGVTIFIGITTTVPGTTGSPGSPDLISNPSGPECTATPMNIGHVSAGWVRAGLAANPDTVPWTVSCDNGYFGIAWVPTDAPGAPDVLVGTPPVPGVDPTAVAEALYGFIPLPPITLEANPGTGLVALPSWFWVEGYGGETLYGAETLGDTTVEVEVTPQHYDWFFGDGTRLFTHSLGRPYPEESDIQHRYEQSSFVAGGAFEVRLEITFGGRYRVITEEVDADGDVVIVVGAWEPLEPMVRSFTRAYPVQQLQSVLAAGQ